jgi:oleate hydratase
MNQPDPTCARAHLVGGGIGSLAAAAILIRDGDMLGKNITIYEELGAVGGALDGSGSPDTGYLVRGGRMFESKYVCTYDLFSSIPTLDGRQTVTQEIFQWNEVIRTGSKARLVRNGRRLVAPEFGLSESQILMVEKFEPRARKSPRRQQDLRSLRCSVFQDKFLADVGDDLRIPALAQRGRAQKISDPFHPHG